MRIVDPIPVVIHAIGQARITSCETPESRRRSRGCKRQLQAVGDDIRVTGLKSADHQLGRILISIGTPQAELHFAALDKVGGEHWKPLMVVCTRRRISGYLKLGILRKKSVEERGRAPRVSAFKSRQFAGEVMLWPNNTSARPVHKRQQNEGRTPLQWDVFRAAQGPANWSAAPKAIQIKAFSCSVETRIKHLGSVLKTAAVIAVNARPLARDYEHLSAASAELSMARRKKRRIAALSRRLSPSDLDLRTNPATLPIRSRRASRPRSATPLRGSGS